MKKNFILGFISGGIICAAITGFAVEYAVTENPYPVKVNGETTVIEGYNINDSTYFKLRDIADAVGGFRVDFVNDEIALTNVDPAPVPTPTPTPAPTKAISELAEGEAVDGIETTLIGDKWYVSMFTIEDKYKGDYAFNIKADDTYLIGWRDKVFFDNYPQGGEKNRYVELNWYNTVLQSWLASEGWK